MLLFFLLKPSLHHNYVSTIGLVYFILCFGLKLCESLLQLVNYLHLLFQFLVQFYFMLFFISISVYFDLEHLKLCIERLFCATCRGQQVALSLAKSVQNCQKMSKYPWKFGRRRIFVYPGVFLFHHTLVKKFKKFLHIMTQDDLPLFILIHTLFLKIFF